MVFLRAVIAEFRKLKRTVALWMMVLAPVVVMVLMTFMMSQMPSILVLRGGWRWVELTKVVVGLWALLVMPFLITLETALLAGLEHNENQWRRVLVLPVPRWSVYMAKLVLAVLILSVSAGVLLLGIVVTGLLLPHLNRELRFEPGIPWAASGALVAKTSSLGFLATAIQHWVAIRWRPFAVPVGAGFVAIVIGVILAGSKSNFWEVYYPWTVATRLLAQPPANYPELLAYSGLGGLAVAIGGCWDFCRRDVA